MYASPAALEHTHPLRNRILPAFSSSSLLLRRVLPFEPRADLPDGTIHGVVADSSGSILVGVQITAHSPSVGGSFKAVTDAEGNYRLTELPPGTDYTVEAQTQGFEKFVRTGLVVRAGLNVTVDISLSWVRKRKPSRSPATPP